LLYVACVASAIKVFIHKVCEADNCLSPVPQTIYHHKDRALE